jgi:hypothetical protein
LIAQIRSEAGHSAPSSGSEALPLRVRQRLPRSRSVTVIEESSPCLVEFSGCDIPQERLSHFKVLAKEPRFTRKLQQGRQDWLNENGGLHESPVSEYESYSGRASVRVADEVHWFVASMVYDASDEGSLVIVR